MGRRADRCSATPTATKRLLRPPRPRGRAQRQPPQPSTEIAASEKSHQTPLHVPGPNEQTPRAWGASIVKPTPRRGRLSISVARPVVTRGGAAPSQVPARSPVVRSLHVSPRDERRTARVGERRCVRPGTDSPRPGNRIEPPVPVWSSSWPRSCPWSLASAPVWRRGSGFRSMFVAVPVRR